MNRIRPIQSGRRAVGLLDSTILVAVTAMANIPTGMLTRKIHRQDSPDTSNPPTTGPTATATPLTAPHTPNAVPRSLPLNALASRASDTVNTIAPPTPCSPRLSCSISGPWDAPHRADATVNTPNPAK